MIPEHLSKMTALFVSRCQTRGEYGIKWTWHESELRRFLLEVLLATGSHIRLHIDALDEAGEERAVDLIQVLQEVVHRAVEMKDSLHVLFSCRHYPIVSLGQSTIDLGTENSLDIALYVDRQFVSHSITPVKSHPLATTLLEKANGIFQWITLVLPGVIRECKKGKSIETIKKTIKKLPPELHEL